MSDIIIIALAVVIFTLAFSMLARHGDYLKWQYGLFKQRCAFAVAWALPRWLVRFAAIRLIAHGTTGVWGNTNVTDVRAMTVLKRWDENNHAKK
jgi:hypothetical protein